MDVSLDSLVGVPVVPGVPREWGMNPTVIIVVVLVVVVYVALFATAGAGAGAQSTGAAPSTGVPHMETFLWGLFILLLLLNGMAYMFNIDVTASLRGLFDPSPEVNLAIQHDDMGLGTADASAFVPPETTVPEIRTKKQVFHIPGNQYTYEDAKAVCDAYGGGLANYSQLEGAYEGGADWCSYGWSDDQLALYPTQKQKWQALQGIPGHQHDCGRPGINGGYIANPKVRFGVNCFGFKPKITREEADGMETASLYPQTQRELDFERLVSKWRGKLPDILVAPFNHDNWSMPGAGPATRDRSTS